MYDRVKNASKYRIMRIFVKMREHCVNRYGYNSFLCGDPRSGHDFLRGLYICRSHRRQRHLRPPFPPIFTVFLSISIALLPHALSDFYLLHTFAEEFTSVVCDPSHRVPHPLIKDCATDMPSPMWIHLFFAPRWCWQPWPPSDQRATKSRLENGSENNLLQSLFDNRGLCTLLTIIYLSEYIDIRLQNYCWSIREIQNCLFELSETLY